MYIECSALFVGMTIREALFSIFIHIFKSVLFQTRGNIPHKNLLNENIMDAQNTISEPISRSASSAPNILKVDLEAAETKPLMRRNKSDIFRATKAPEAITKGKLEREEIETLLQTERKSKCVDSKIFLLALVGQLLGSTIAILLYLFILFPVTNNATVAKVHLVPSNTVSEKNFYLVINYIII